MSYNPVYSRKSHCDVSVSFCKGYFLVVRCKFETSRKFNSQNAPKNRGNRYPAPALNQARPHKRTPRPYYIAVTGRPQSTWGRFPFFTRRQRTFKDWNFKVLSRNYLPAFVCRDSKHKGNSYSQTLALCTKAEAGNN